MNTGEATPSTQDLAPKPVPGKTTIAVITTAALAGIAGFAVANTTKGHRSRHNRVCGHLHHRVPTPSAENVAGYAHIAPGSLGLVTAGLTIRLGMVLSGGCMAGHLARLQEGRRRSLLALGGAVVGLGAAFPSRHLGTPT
jgi:uncharacterized membrane protein YedE/YeeE